MTDADLARTADTRDEHGPNQEQPPAGQYRLVIAKGASQDVLKATDPEDFTVAMDVSSDASVLRLTSYVDPSVASFCGPEIPMQASYSFQANESELVLKPRADDPCADRDSILTGTWKKG